jgi:hypothetical protein
MQLEVKLLLLKIVKYNGDVTPLVKLGYEYAQVMDFLNELLNEKLLIKEGYQLNITSAGLSTIEDLNKEFKRKDASNWIEPDLASRISKIDKNEIFLPDPNELSF